MQLRMFARILSLNCMQDFLGSPVIDYRWLYGLGLVYEMIFRVQFLVNLGAFLTHS